MYIILNKTYAAVLRTSLICETFSMPQNGLQFLLIIPTIFPVGFPAASAAEILNCADPHKHVI